MTSAISKHWKPGLRVFSTQTQTPYNQINIVYPPPSDLDIAKSVQPQPIANVAEQIGLLPEELEKFGEFKAKVSLEAMHRLERECAEKGKYVVVTAISPTPLGEGKSTVAVGIGQAMGAILKKKSFVNIRQPSMGPMFGVKGGAAGGGYSQVIPMEEFNLHLTGDIHAVSQANNLLACALDTRIYHESKQTDKQLFNRLCPKNRATKKRSFTPIMKRRLRTLGIDKEDPDTLTEEEKRRFARLDIDTDTVTWRRVIDMNDRTVRAITLGVGSDGADNRESAIDIAVASEVMAILALSNDIGDMRERFGRIVVAQSTAGEAITAEDVGCAGAMTAIMRDAIKPSLMQTLEGTPVFVHAGPFANIAHGASSITADRIALRLAGKDGWVFTEGGFGSDIGLEKFCNIKTRYSGLHPDAAVIVGTMRSLKMHGGGPPVSPGKPIPAEYSEPNPELVRKGCSHLKHHIKNVQRYGAVAVVALNKGLHDSDDEIEVVRQACAEEGVEFSVVSCWGDGSAGATDICEKLIKATEQPTDFKFLYDLDLPIKDKIQAVADSYGPGVTVEYSELAEKRVADYTRLGFDKLPICAAKTQWSLSCDPSAKGTPSNFTVTVKDLRASVGAAFLVAQLGDVMLMPGLPTRPSFYDIDVDADGNITGLF